MEHDLTDVFRFIKRLRVTGPCSLQLQVVMRSLQEVEVGAVLA